MSNDILKETNHDYQNCIVGNFDNATRDGNFNSWNDFKEEHCLFAKNDPSFKNCDDRYNFVFRYDIHKNEPSLYTLELCIMFQRKGMYSHIYVENITSEELNTEVKLWLKGRLDYLKELWKEVDFND